MNYVEIAVFSKTDGLKDVFTYCIDRDKKVEIGQVVKVPFKNRKLYGILTNQNLDKPSFSVRPIEEITEIIIPKHLIDTSHFISEYFWSPFAMTLKTMLPQGFYKKRRAIEEKGKRKKEKGENELKLTKDQEKVLKKIKESTSEKPFLLFGVTGSGKTEIYMSAIAETLKEGKSAIVLVPEISLTPQTIKRFEERFPGNIAVLHSGLKETERQKNWDGLFDGSKNIAIGPRSALFAPLKNIGIIIMDEEHDGSYKQETSPRYDARKVAEFIAKNTGAKLILGSATPRIESFYNAKNNNYNFLELNTRITQEKPPIVEIVDLREEYHKNNYSSFSYNLEQNIKNILDKKRKIILFLNRRGNATYVFCRDCGFVLKCPNCDIPLIHHFAESYSNSKKQIANSNLICHHCDFKKEIPGKCPECQSLAIKYYGLGIQKVEAEIKKIFPGARVIRMDKDTTQDRDSYQKIFDDFTKSDTDILLGTQMVTKGWDVSEVDLVGVISADNAINFPDFRSGEKTFQLLTQVAGRSGRKDNRGKAVIQTFNPDNPVLEFVKKHDYTSFYKKEIEERKRFNYPPFSTLVRIIIKEKDEERAKEEAYKQRDILDNLIEKGYNKTKILGPSPCFLSKVQGYFRWNIIIKTTEKEKDEIIKSISNKWIIDVDPINLI